jgi:hypothetical protein
MLAHVTVSGLNSLGSEIARLQTGFAGSARPFLFQELVEPAADQPLPPRPGSEDRVADRNSVRS